MGFLDQKTLDGIGDALNFIIYFAIFGMVAAAVSVLGTIGYILYLLFT